eukprot:8623428-Pyramimonas_sp.AAC.1
MAREPPAPIRREDWMQPWPMACETPVLRARTQHRDSRQMQQRLQAFAAADATTPFSLRPRDLALANRRGNTKETRTNQVAARPAEPVFRPVQAALQRDGRALRRRGPGARPA